VIFAFPQHLELNHRDVKEKIIYVYAEQGYGDIIQFARYAAMLAQLGAKIIFAAPISLIKLFSTLGEILRSSIEEILCLNTTMLLL
jgi:hypothetical protein